MLFDKYVSKWVVGNNNCVEVFNTFEEAEKRREYIETSIRNTLEKIGLSNNVKVYVHNDRSLNHETSKEEYRIEISFSIKNLRYATFAD